MMKELVGELVRRPVVGVAPENMLSEAVGVMRREGISCIPVMQDGRAVGIVTERSLVRLMAKEGGRLVDRPMSEVMSTPVITVSDSMYLYEALHIFVNRGIRHLVVVDALQRARGVFTLSDLVERIGTQLMVEFQTVDRFMSNVVFTVSEDVNLRQVLSEMANRAISCVIYSTNGRPEGMLTERDVVRLAAAGEDLEAISLTSVMSSPVVQVERTAQVHEVARILRGQAIRRVVVVDQHGAIVGLATQTNIMRAMESSYVKILKQVIHEKQTELSSTSKELDELSLYLDTILNTSIDMAIVAMDKDFRIIFFNGCAERILGYPGERAMGRTVHDIHLDERVDAESFEKVIVQVVSEGNHSYTFDRVIDEEKRHFQARVSAIRNREGTDLLGYVYMVQDITERKRAEENIRYMAYHDILTGLPNRVAFDERLGLELSHAERKEQRLAVLMVDLDRFKEVNDTLGHFAGDMLLEAVARRLSGALRKSDTVARVGGDEFMVVLPDVRKDEHAMRIGRKLVAALSKPIDLKGQDHQASISVGMAFYPDHGARAERLVERADQAMYAAKELGRESGRSNLCVWDADAPRCRKG